MFRATSKSNRWRLMLTLSLLFLSMTLSSHAFGQTSIVVIRTGREIVIAADSKATAGNDQAIQISLCKIQQFGSVFFTSAGFLFSPATGFSVLTVAKNASDQKLSLAQKVAYFEGAIIKPMTNQIEWEKKTNIAVFRREYEAKEMLQVVFAGFENGIPVMRVRSFRTATSSSGQTSFFLAQKRDCPGDCKGDLSTVFLGENEAILAYLSRHPKFWKRGVKLADIAKYFVLLEVADKGEFVGKPVDVLRINKTGPHWIQRKPQCQEKKDTPKPATAKPRRSRKSIHEN